jgi:hypothetical protein
VNDQQLANAQDIASAVECNFDHDVAALGYGDGIRKALTQPVNNETVRQALIDLATHLDGKESAAEFVDAIDNLVDELG